MKIYGASDDLIEIEGDDTDEIGAYNTVKYLHFDTGHILKVWYSDDGIWKIEEIRPGRGACSIECCNDPDDDPYSDVAILPEAKRWCATSGVDGPSESDIDTWWDNLKYSDQMEGIKVAAYASAHPWIAASTGHKVEGGGE